MRTRSTLMIAAVLMALPIAARAQYYPPDSIFSNQRNDEIARQNAEAEAYAAQRRFDDVENARRNEELNRRLNSGIGSSAPQYVPYNSQLMPGLTPQGFSRY